jgi:hypothetical protein
MALIGLSLTVAYRFQQDLGVTGIKSDQAFLGFDDANWRQGISAEDIDALGGLLNGGLGPLHLFDTVQKAFVGDRAVRGLHQFKRSPHLPSQGHFRFLSPKIR